MKALTLLTIAALALASWAAAQDLRPDQRLAERQFADIDQDDDGRLTPEEFAAYGDLVFVSMDSDESGSLDEPEFLGWGFGMQNLADAAGTRQGYDTALRLVFDLWDRDNDGAVLLDEQRDAQGMAFAFADADEDGGLGQAEFADNYVLNIALRTALSAAP
jgi:Ca2+-binding EF-hand superfamily protein